MATGIIDLTIANTFESRTITDRIMIAAQYSNSGSERIKVHGGESCEFAILPAQL